MLGRVVFDLREVVRAEYRFFVIEVFSYVDENVAENILYLLCSIFVKMCCRRSFARLINCACCASMVEFPEV